PADIVDVLPTLLALAGEPVPGGLDGRPIAGALAAEPRSAPDPLPEAGLVPRRFDADETRELAARLAGLGYL
ncbi:MAG TPA: phosphodiesterase, partial [Verrucomicrobiae bacterium]|nr:phosphodiesterase [Verrucomicrobiae bacterium]